MRWICSRIPCKKTARSGGILIHWNELSLSKKCAQNLANLSIYFSGVAKYFEDILKIGSIFRQSLWNVISYFSSMIYEEKNYKCKFFKFNFNLKWSAFIEVVLCFSLLSCCKKGQLFLNLLTKALIFAVSPRCFSVWQSWLVCQS